MRTCVDPLGQFIAGYDDPASSGPIEADDEEYHSTEKIGAATAVRGKLLVAAVAVVTTTMRMAADAME